MKITPSSREGMGVVHLVCTFFLVLFLAEGSAKECATTAGETKCLLEVLKRSGQNVKPVQQKRNFRPFYDTLPSGGRNRSTVTNTNNNNNNNNKEFFHYRGLNTEQLHNRQNDKIRKLRLHHTVDRYVHSASPYQCDFENECKWTWQKDIDYGFYVTSAGTDSEYQSNGPQTDASGKRYGNFLLLRITETTKQLRIVSPVFGPSLNNLCRFQVWIYQELMNEAEIHIIAKKIDSKIKDETNDTQILFKKIDGDDSQSWSKYEVPLGNVSHNFVIILEVVPAVNFVPGSVVAFDNITVLNYFHKGDSKCDVNEYNCQSTDQCISKNKVCNIVEDCPAGDDETQNCDRMPFGSRCSFEEDWCGWSNVENTALRWLRHQGSTPTNLTGPNHDHTYLNSTGHYLFVKMLIPNTPFGSSAVLQSVVFNPPPNVHGNSSSMYHNSCSIRFFMHQLTIHMSSISLELIVMKPTGNDSNFIFRNSKNLGDTWILKEVPLPNISYKYYFQFISQKAFGSISDIAIDDVSLSPECFGLNIPPEDLNGYNYWNSAGEINIAAEDTHSHFSEKPFYQFTTCGAKGRFGPTELQCIKYYNNTSVDVSISQENNFNGVQKWIVPSEGFYTLILMGASGGKGNNGLGLSRGALVRIVIELNKGEELFILVGQKGGDACIKTTIGQKVSNTSCNVGHINGLQGIRNILPTSVTDGGGGGGGGSFVFLRESNELIPLAVAAGAGGLGLGKFSESGEQHGHGEFKSRPDHTGEMAEYRSSGGGGGWSTSLSVRYNTISQKQVMGRSLVDEGAIGGKACYNSTDGRGDGGFGGGGGGCAAGGGGGGYFGGDITVVNSSNGDGGYSFVDHRKAVENLVEIVPGYNSGDGEVFIIPAVVGCDCNYRCVALDSKRAQTSCICPENWNLKADGTTCVPFEGSTSLKDLYPPWFVILLIVTVICLTIAFAVVCFILYNRYQHRTAEILNRKVLSGADLQLDRLRITSDGLMTEYNPNYEFGGVIYTLKDLKELPREQLRLVKALGQGAFGEVYQGYYKEGPNDTIETSVAVKTLPEMSTSQAEMDFLMEALIMSKFDHPNIVRFMGVCFDKHPRFIVLELLAGGDLKNFLRESRPKSGRISSLTMKDLVLISVDVAKGCKYLEQNRFIHRDIAARNCLLTTKLPDRVVKIADFGMSRDVYRSDYYRKGGKAMLPIKWMPPEAFLDGIFTSKTDVWSFGILLWEIMSMGYMPYTGCANREVMQLVTSGGRLDPPLNCPSPIYGLMTQCWHPAPEQRPNFGTVLERLGYCLQDPEVLQATLPLFDRPASSEQDTTLMRPQNSNSACLQVASQSSSDYLIPNNAGLLDPESSSVEKLIPDTSDNWEGNFSIKQSQSTQPLLLDSNQHNKDTVDMKACNSESTHNNNNNNSNNNNIAVNSGELPSRTGVLLDIKALTNNSGAASKNKLKSTEEPTPGNGNMSNGPVEYINILPSAKTLVNNTNNSNSKKKKIESK